MMLDHLTSLDGHSLMRHSLFLVVIGILGTVSLAQGDDEKKLTEPASGPSTVPGSFQSWMVTGKHQGRFHSPVCEFGLHPMVLIFARDPIETDKAFGDLLKKLDQSIVKHPGLDSGASAILLTNWGFRAAVEAGGDEFGKKLALASMAKDELEEKLRRLKKDKELDRVTLGLVNEEKVQDYKLDDKAVVTVLLCNEQAILSRHDLPKEKLTEPEAGKIANEFEKLLQRLDTPARGKRRK